MILILAMLISGCQGDRAPGPVVPPVLTEPNDGNASYSDRHGECAYQTLVTDVVTPDPSRFQARRHAGSQEEMNYRLFVPTDYDRNRSYPIVLLLHGGGSRGPDNESQLAGVGPYLFSGEQVQSQHPSFVLVPKVEDVNGQWASDDDDRLSINLLTVLEILDALEEEFSIDAQRLYVLGGSLGGAGTWDLLTKRPERFAAFVPYAAPIRWAWLQRGRLPTVMPAAAAALRGKSFWFLYGENDANFGLKPWWDELALYIRAAGGDPKFTEYVNGEHVIGTCVFTEPDLIRWLYSHRRDDEE
ncbi:MAG: prolyl oligopeptidase family serine peptidase [Gemmatimonadetes bacterium]|nr:prolyl oligopeptidase family serine peptidase [Gemmatimonadota bacterium]